MFNNLTLTHLIIIGVVSLVATTIIVGTVISTKINKSSSSRKLGKLEISSVKNEWKRFESGSVLLDNVFVGGSNSDGGSIYVCRVESSVSSELLPGMYDPVQGSCQMTWGGKAYSYSKFDLLTTNDPSSLVWLGNKDGEVSFGSIVGGLADHNDELYISRAIISGGQAIGKVHGRHSKAYVPFAGKETEIFSYEVLCSIDYKL